MQLIGVAKDVRRVLELIAPQTGNGGRVSSLTFLLRLSRAIRLVANDEVVHLVFTVIAVP